MYKIKTIHCKCLCLLVFHFFMEQIHLLKNKGFVYVNQKTENSAFAFTYTTQPMCNNVNIMQLSPQEKKMAGEQTSERFV